MKKQLTPSEQAYSMIKSFEGLSLVARKAIKEEKYYTIGYGHYGADVEKGQLISLQRAEQLLHQDLQTISVPLAESCPALTQQQYDALCSLIYNIGWYSFRHSTTFLYIQQLGVSKQPIDVARRIVLWVRAGGRVLLGLQRRRVIEANYFLGNEHFKVIDGQIQEII